LTDNRIDEKNRELCPICKRAIVRSDERVVDAGKEYHKACHIATQQGDRSYSSNISRANIEVCPGCKHELAGHPDKIVVGGKEWHRDCYNRF